MATSSKDAAKNKLYVICKQWSCPRKLSQYKDKCNDFNRFSKNTQSTTKKCRWTSHRAKIGSLVQRAQWRKKGYNKTLYKGYKRREIYFSQALKDHNLLKKVKIKRKEQEKRLSLQEHFTTCSTPKVQQPLPPEGQASPSLLWHFCVNEHSNTATRKGQREAQLMFCKFHTYFWSEITKLL